LQPPKEALTKLVVTLSGAVGCVTVSILVATQCLTVSVTVTAYIPALSPVNVGVFGSVGDHVYLKTGVAPYVELTVGDTVIVPVVLP
jgi:hypothetical protein